MKSRIGVISVMVFLGALLGALPANATTATLNPLCIMGSHSDAGPPYQTHWRIGSTGSIVYWLHSQVAPGPNISRPPHGEYFICDPLALPHAHAMDSQEFPGQPPCTAQGTFATIVGDKIASYDYVGQQSALSGQFFPILKTYRFWHIRIQNQPGQWSWHDSLVAVC